MQSTNVLFNNIFNSYPKIPYKRSFCNANGCVLVAMKHKLEVGEIVCFIDDNGCRSIVFQYDGHLNIVISEKINDNHLVAYMSESAELELRRFGISSIDEIDHRHRLQAIFAAVNAHNAKRMDQPNAA